MKRLALFDLDNTLLNGDSDYAWGCFMVRKNLVNGALFEAENRRFYQNYLDGVLDIQAYLEFQLAPLAGMDRTQLDGWHAVFMEEMIEPIILPKAEALLRSHREAGELLAIVTATNRFVTGPIARRLGVEHLLATELEEREGHFTGRPAGVPCFQQGKVTRLKAWMEENRYSLKGSCFYSDSRNDIPLLAMVENPVAVDPDPVLRAHAEAMGWPVISLR